MKEEGEERKIWRESYKFLEEKEIKAVWKIIYVWLCNTQTNVRTNGQIKQ